ncbi:monocarboxylate transporter 12-B isoform X1 [Pleuronectes platessa]|uniref:monocarboxylate transporter 12-B isoform X1 n=1 Tax=Pleuronectes platessa TaxID=8262 RepID=UPI00232A2630|nr:monocarboxylate transporter 12-B isoform X1 [Pleuronectes platessa]
MAVNKEEKPKEGRSTTGVPTPPEGGWGWMIVAGCFLATICIRAVTRCVSIFFVEFQLHFEQDYSTTAWIHSLIDCTTMLCAPLGGFLGSRVSCRATVILGGLLSAAGFVLSSFASSLEYLYSSLGILTGLGFALSYTPAIAMVGRYFNERKALAYGIAQSGCGIGTFILAPVVQLLIEQYSWRGALLILGGFVANLCVVGALMKPLEIRGERNSEKLTNSEQDCLTTVLDTKDTEKVPADGRQVEPKQLEISNLKETRRLLISNGAFKNIRLENDKPTDVKMAECILFSNKLTETVLGEIKRSEAKLTNGSTIEDMKLIESMILSSKADKTDVKTEDSELSKPKPEAVSPPPALVNTNPSSRSRCFCLESTKEYGFLVMPDFLILSVSFLFLAYGCSAPVVYLVPYALSVGVDHQHAAFLMSIFGVSGIVGNITFGWVTDRKCLKKYRMLSFMVALGFEGLCCMFAPLLHSFSLLALFAVLYGYFDGAYVALIPVVTSDIVGSTHLTSGLGVVYFLHAIPYLISPPIGGWLVDRTGDYAATFLLSGACFLLSSAVLISTMLVRRCRRSKCSSAAHLDPNGCASVAAQQGII